MYALASRIIGAAVFCVALLAGPTAACSIAVGTSGQLRLSGDGTTLGSEVSGTTPATVTTVLPLLSGVHVDVSAPTLSQSPGGYNSASQTLQVAYTAAVLGLLTVRTQAYTSGATSFPTGLLGAVTLTITLNNRILNTSGFQTGTYGTQTVVTCRP